MTRGDFKDVVLLLEAHWHHDEPAEEVYSLYWHELEDFDLTHVIAAVEAIARSGKTRMPLAGEIVRKVSELRLDAPSWAEAIRHYMHAKHGVAQWRPPEECLDGNPFCNGEGQVTKPEPYDLNKRARCECTATAPRVERVRRFRMFQEGRADPCPAGKCDGSGLVPVTITREHEVTSRCTCWSRVQDSKFVAMHPVLRRFIDLVTWSSINDMLVGGDTTLEAQLRSKYEGMVRELIEQDTLRGLNAPGLPRIERANTPDGRRALPRRRGEPEPLDKAVGAALDRLR